MISLSWKLAVFVLAAQAAPAPTPAPSQATAPAAAASGAEAPHAYLMVRCINTTNGDKYRDFMLATTAKTMQVRADEGDIAGWIFARAVMPSGAASTCDFMQMNLYRRFPPQRTPIDPYFAKAGLNMTRADWYKGMGEVSKLMRLELWRGVEELGRAEKGHFMHLEYVKVAPEKVAEWRRIERTLWRPLRAAGLADGGLSAWMVQELLVPGGTGEPYNARVLTVAPSWEGLASLPPLAGQEPALARVHRGMAPTTLVSRTAAVRTSVRTELFEILAVIRPASR